MMFLSIYCSYDSCERETNISKCQEHTMEVEYNNYYSCFKRDYAINEYSTECFPFFYNKEMQKIYYKGSLGIMKEHFLELNTSFEFPFFDKESYDIDEILKYKKINLKDVITEEDIKIGERNNTCASKSFYYRDTLLERNKNVCFNVDRIEDLKDIFDCGYITLKGNYNNTPFTFTDCHYIPDAKVDANFKQFYKDIGFKNIKTNYFYAIDFLLKRDEGKSMRRLYEEIQAFEMIVEDRHGNVLRINQKGELIDETINNDEPKKFLNSCGKNSLNFILLLSLLLFLR